MDPTETSPSRESDRVEKELRQLILTLQIEPGLAISESSSDQTLWVGTNTSAGGFPTSG